MKPFQNEKDTLSIDGLTIENRYDRVEVYGSLQITRDKAGLVLAEQLEGTLQKILHVLRSQKLADHVTVTQTEKIDNPFKN